MWIIGALDEAAIRRHLNGRSSRMTVRLFRKFVNSVLAEEVEKTMIDETSVDLPGDAFACIILLVGDVNLRSSILAHLPEDYFSYFTIFIIFIWKHGNNVKRVSKCLLTRFTIASGHLDYL